MFHTTKYPRKIRAAQQNFRTPQGEFLKEETEDIDHRKTRDLPWRIRFHQCFKQQQKTMLPSGYD